MEPTKLKELAEERFDHELYRKNLRERVEGQLIVSHNGSMFKATQQLISFLSVFDTDTIYLEDVNGKPSMVNRVQLLDQLKESYQYAMNAWHNEYNDSSKIRKGKNV